VFGKRERTANGPEDRGAHHAWVIGSARASHDRIAALNGGSYASCGYADDRCATTGHMNATVRAA
jgi:hypothetical protein